MKKFSALFISVLLIFSTLFAISPAAYFYMTDIPDPVPISDELKQQIVKDKGWENMHPDDYKIEYFATMSDGSVLLRTSKKGSMSTANIVEDVIGDYLYVASSPAALVKLYKNNKFYNIKNAYDEGVIDSDTLNQIALILNFRLIGSTTDLGSETEYRIKQSYINKHKLNEDKDVPLTDITLKHYGTTSKGNILVLCSSKYFAYTCDITEETIGKYIYRYSGNHVVLFSGYSFYEIKEAYDTGRIDDAELDEIAKFLNFRLASEDDTTPVESTNATEATTQTQANNNTNTGNANGAIATGENSTTVCVVLAVVALATGVVLKATSRKRKTM